MDTQSTITSPAGVQKIGKKVSSELPKVKDPNINIRDKFNDILAEQKYMLVNYQIAINEMMNADLQGILMDSRNKIQGAHTAFLNAMFNLGEYQADVATPPQVADAYDVFNGYRTQLPFQ